MGESSECLLSGIAVIILLIPTYGTTGLPPKEGSRCVFPTIQPLNHSLKLWPYLIKQREIKLEKRQSFWTPFFRLVPGSTYPGLCCKSYITLFKEKGAVAKWKDLIPQITLGHCWHCSLLYCSSVMDIHQKFKMVHWSGFRK